MQSILLGALAHGTNPQFENSLRFAISASSGLRVATLGMESSVNLTEIFAAPQLEGGMSLDL